MLPSIYAVPLVESLQQRPTSVALWGEERAVLTRVAVGLAKKIDPAFLWFDIQRTGSAPAPWQHALEAEAGPGRLHVLEIDEMRLDHGSGNAASSVLVRGSESDSESLAFADLMRVPERIRDVLLHADPASPPRLVLLTNVERASAAFEGRSGALRPYVEAFNSRGVTVLVTACGRPRENRHDLDLVLHVDGVRGGDDETATVVCDGVRSSGSFPAIPPGTRYQARAFTRTT